MDRRDFLKYCSLVPFVFVPKFKFDVNFNNKKEQYFGWIPGNRSQKDRLYNLGNLKGFGADKVSCLWKPWEQVNNHAWIPHFQFWGDCVAHGTGTSIDLLTCILILIRKKRIKYITDSSTDAIYSGGRNLIAKRTPSAGMMGEWAVKYLKEYGNLLRKPYPPYDLTPYSEETVKHWDKNGLPDSLLVEAKKHPLLDYALVKSWEEVRDAVSGGNPVVFCASLGADDDQRDEDGFIKPKGRWAHCWCIAGVQDGKRPGALLINSHGPLFGKGPKTYGQPDGSVWIDAEHIDYHVKKYEDSFALSNYKGFDKPDRDYIIW